MHMVYTRNILYQKTFEQLKQLKRLKDNKKIML